MLSAGLGGWRPAESLGARACSGATLPAMLSVLSPRFDTLVITAGPPAAAGNGLDLCQALAHSLVALLCADRPKILPVSHRGIVRIIGTSAPSAQLSSRRGDIEFPLNDPTDIFGHSNTQLRIDGGAPLFREETAV
jgi:hypothetical protein